MEKIKDLSFLARRSAEDWYGCENECPYYDRCTVPFGSTGEVLPSENDCSAEDYIEAWKSGYRAGIKKSDGDA